ncbi:fumarylacetoacetate hydrolase [Leucosporidium creatinivorum]|uniref:Fumarylacetoacetate hydrolase n=1 Tax=Leucosporidium creatinivorum TaxID=106004 RepID=A0A1Y2G214_9BASI|nr:fumarylacetoacetate hydrolase [Leucosporidium creatinivorum]
MAPPTHSWSRLIRFIAKEDGKTYFGQPLQKGDIGLLYHAKKPLTAHILTCSPLLPTSKLTETLKTVQTLLSPLGREDVDEIRGMAAQYPPAGKAKVIPEVPGLFYKPRTTLTGPETPIFLPEATRGEGSDYEVEICAVIGKPGKDIPVEKAYEHVLAYCTVNDITSRGLAAKGGQVGFGKSYDTWTPLGPALISPAALGDPMNLKIETTVNGELRQKANTGDMNLSIAELIHRLSRGVTLETGSLILTGSPLPLERPAAPFLVHGDEVRVFVEGCGTLINSIVEEGRPSIKAKL